MSATIQPSASPSAATQPRIGVILTGGTIESIGTDRLDLAWYIESGQRLAAGELLSAVPEITSIADIVEIPFGRMPSHAMTDSDWLKLLRTIHARLADDRLDGIVITHGTNTLEETAFFLHLTLKTDKPVVLVGAMRPSSALSADGYLNLLNAVRVAASPDARGKGCLVVLNDTIFSARDCTKTSTYRVEAFQSRDIGPLGVADGDGKVVFYHHAARPHTQRTAFDAAALTSLPRVDVVVSYIGSDGVMIDAVAAAGAKAIVCAGTGAGRPSPAEDEAFDRVFKRHGTIMCLSSRVAGGRVVRSPGLKQRGFVAGDNLPPWKAKVLMALALTITQEPDAIQHLFDSY